MNKMEHRYISGNDKRGEHESGLARIDGGVESFFSAQGEAQSDLNMRKNVLIG